ncbi:hypothetical protein ACWELJ_31025 [Nocardia sp. NPDC004582]
MRKALRGIVIAGFVTTAGVIGAQSASATPPVITTEPGGVIRADIAPGEWWNCGGWSLRPPFINGAPPIGLVQGPGTARMTFTPGADVWVFCTRNWLPNFDAQALIHPELDWNHVIRTQN